MANGDKAAAAGMDVVPGTADLRLGYDEDNKTRDYLAEHITEGSHTIGQILGLAAALDDKQAALGFTPVRQGGGVGMGNNTVRLGWDGSRLRLQVDDVQLGGVLTTANPGPGVQPGQDVTFGHIYTPVGRATPAVSSYVTAYINGDGRIAGGASSRRFKKDIAAWSPDQQAVLALQLVTFRYKAAVYGSADAPVEVGLIAEDLHDLGLTWLVFYDEEGQPQGVHYERIALALLPVVQELAMRIDNHEARLAKLEEQN